MVCIIAPHRPRGKERDGTALYDKSPKAKYGSRSSSVEPKLSTQELDGVYRSSYKKIHADEVLDSDEVDVDLPVDQVQYKFFLDDYIVTMLTSAAIVKRIISLIANF